MNCLPGCWKGCRGYGSGTTSQARRHRPSRTWRYGAVPACPGGPDYALEAATSSFTLTLLAVTAAIAVYAVWRRIGSSTRNVLDL